MEVTLRSYVPEGKDTERRLNLQKFIKKAVMREDQIGDLKIVEIQRDCIWCYTNICH